MNVRALAGIALGAAISMASACASTGVKPQPFPTPPERQESPPTEHPLMTPGASLIISDLGMSHETGKGTDFIVLTR